MISVPFRLALLVALAASRTAFQSPTPGEADAIRGAIAQSDSGDRQRSGSREPASGSVVVVASKPFGESYLLAEMFAQLLEARGIDVERRPGLGATEVAYAALRTGAIDVYPEYTGTGLLAILDEPPRRDPREVFAIVQRALGARDGVRWLPPLGFENTYAIAMRRSMADSLGVRTLSDLARVAPRLRAGLTPDFIGRPDGLPGLAAAYAIEFASVQPLAQALKYRALASGGVDVVDGYSTDGLIARYGLTVLEDDRAFFPPYEAAALVGRRVARDDPRVISVLTELSGRLDEPTMRELNARIEVRGESIADVAASALRTLGLADTVPVRATAAPGPTRSVAEFIASRRGELLAQAGRHLVLVLLSLGAAILVALPIGLVLVRRPRLAEPVIRVAGMIETIPSIALLAFMIPVLGVGVWPALVALWLYGLYPIVRHTYSGVRDADADAVHAARALGMTEGQVLRWVRTPLAVPSILAGIRTAAVLSVGTATLAAFIGAGGLGEPIATGLALADTRLILSGAIPAAALALAVDGALALVEWRFTPAPLRRRRVSPAHDRAHDRH